MTHEDYSTLDVALLLKRIKPQHTPTDVKEDEHHQREGCKMSQRKWAYSLLIQSMHELEWACKLEVEDYIHNVCPTLVIELAQAMPNRMFMYRSHVNHYAILCTAAGNETH